MHPWNEEAGQLEQVDRVAPDEGDIEIARAWPLRVEWRSVLPPDARDGTAAQDHTCVGWNRHTNRVAEALIPRLVAIEGQSDERRALLLFGELVLTRPVRLARVGFHRHA